MSTVSCETGLLILRKLYAAAKLENLDFFGLYSSTAALLGAAGQGNYAAANSCLDALAQHWSLKGLNALSVQWGPWLEVGMAAQNNSFSRLKINGISNEPLDKSRWAGLLLIATEVGHVRIEQCLAGRALERPPGLRPRAVGGLPEAVPQGGAQVLQGLEASVGGEFSSRFRRHKLV